MENANLIMGDYVRIKQDKGIFQKGTKARWSEKIYQIFGRDGYSFQLLDGSDVMKRTYKHHELQKVSSNNPDRLKKELRDKERETKILSQDKVIKRIMRELDVSREKAMEMIEANQKEQTK